jgi:hypothetical protein
MSYALLQDQTGGPGAVSRFYSGRQATQEAISRLIEASVEFHVEPLPDDEWQITLKGEAEGALR